MDRLRLLLFAVLAVLDVTGRTVYDLLRRALPTPPSRQTSIEPFRYSAQVMMDAYRSATGMDK